MLSSVSDELQNRGLPSHIEAAIRSSAELHAKHEQQATPLQRVFGTITSNVASSWFFAALTCIIIIWVGFNLFAGALGYEPYDPPPFHWLTFALALGSLYVVILIYATQRREDQLAQLREQLILELALLSEQKTAKVIQLLEEFRRDIPIVDNRIDEQADAMAEPADPERVLEAIQETHAEAKQINGEGRS
jgi:uncharacterized membrane protein